MRRKGRDKFACHRTYRLILVSPAPVQVDGHVRQARQVLGGGGVVVRDADRAGNPGPSFRGGAGMGEVEEEQPPRAELGLGRGWLAFPADYALGGLDGPEEIRSVWEAGSSQ